MKALSLGDRWKLRTAVIGGTALCGIVAALLSVFAFLSISGCGGGGDGDASTPANCDQARTGGIILRNGNTNQSYRIVIDNAVPLVNGQPLVLGPGQQSSPQTVTAQVVHSVQFINSVTGQVACNFPTVSVGVCQNVTLNCQ